MTSCPVCAKPVDPIRAPAVAVRDGKVVSYCSKECASLHESGPAKLAPTKQLRMPSTDERLDRELGPSSQRMKAVTPSSGVVTADGAPAPDSAPVIEIVRDPSRPVAVAEPRRRKRHDSVQIADTGHLDDFVTHEPSRRGLWIALVLLVVAGGAAAAYFLGYFDKLLGREAAPVAQARMDAAVVAPVTIDAAPPLTREGALAQAQELLRAQLGEVPRVQNRAAMALSRTGDAKAIEVLVAALQTETGDLAKVELAYALARAGDKRGLDALMTLASPTNREAKHEAGKRLALLGDKRAIKVLEPSINYPQFRLGVAENLAYLAEPRALQILDKVLADPKALPDEKARATVALGWAGRTDAAPALRDLLADNRNNADAAGALANLHDEAARPVLVAQLEASSLSVRAARNLRRLTPDGEFSALLPPLVAGLATRKDTNQIDFAEALLLLTGPPAWSEHE